MPSSITMKRIGFFFNLALGIVMFSVSFDILAHEDDPQIRFT
jgi:hypothetical protein